MRAKDNIEKASKEVKLYVAGNAENRKQTLREQLNQKINEQERMRKQLMEEQKSVKEEQVNKALQVQYWKDLES